MAAKCPNCGEKLHWYDFRAECKHCGANIPNYNWEARLEEDADIAERSFARLHYRTGNFKSAMFGSPLRIVRLVCTLLPLVALVVPLLNATFAFPFREGTESISFLTFVLNYLLKFDLGSVMALMNGEVLGGAITALLLSVLMALIAVVAGVLNFFVVLIGAINLNWLFDVILNAISLVTWGLSALFLSQFTAQCADLSLGLFSGSVSPFYLVGIGLFLLDLVVDLIVGLSLRKQKKTQPTIDEAVEIELKELREDATA
ncbi:MAG: hypothetical protein ACI4LB_06050 [Candidatus Fimenecus sp.]